MFNVLEKPWGLFGLAIASLFIIYLIQLDRRMYWLSLLVLACSVLMHLVIETNLLSFNRIILITLKLILPIAITGLTIFLVMNILDLKERLAYLWLLPIFLCLSAFALDWLIRTDMEKINTVIKSGQNAFEQENFNALSAIVSDNYKDSYHSSKNELVRHCSSYFTEPVFKSITKTSMQIEKKDKQATVTIVVFIIFDDESFVFDDYGVTTAKVAAKLNLKKEKDKNWRIYQTEIIEVNNQPFNWQDVKGI